VVGIIAICLGADAIRRALAPAPVRVLAPAWEGPLAAVVAAAAGMALVYEPVPGLAGRLVWAYRPAADPQQAEDYRLAARQEVALARLGLRSGVGEEGAWRVPG
jgi:hypothetical protein